jgi:tRNA dimethylallyltransferase
MSPSVLVLMGATASGKTDLAIALARRFDAEIVGADSRQIYCGMPIGTAAPTHEQRAAVAHHLVEFLDPRERYSAAQFSFDALSAIRAIHAREKRAIVVGGTGFYLRALTGGVDLAPQYDLALRERLAAETRVHDASFLHQWLSVRDPRRAAMLDPADAYRIVRALEVALAPAQSTLRDETLPTLASEGIAFAKIALDVPLGAVDASIERRTDAMLDAGLVAEAERIGGAAVAASAVGYPQALAYARGWATHAELRATLSRAARRYARRQMTWLRSEPDVAWVRPENAGDAARERLGWV